MRCNSLDADKHNLVVSVITQKAWDVKKDGNLQISGFSETSSNQKHLECF